MCLSPQTEVEEYWPVAGRGCTSIFWGVKRSKKYLLRAAMGFIVIIWRRSD